MYVLCRPKPDWQSFEVHMGIEGGADVRNVTRSDYVR